MFSRLRARAAREGGRGGPDAAPVHAPLRRVRDQPQAREAVRAGRCRRRARRRPHRAEPVASTRAPPEPASPNVVPIPTPAGDDDGRRAVGVEVDGAILRGFPTPSGKLEFWSSTLAAWGWAEQALPGYPQSHIHPDRLAAGPDAADLDLPPARADPHAFGQREVARRDRPHQSAVAAHEGRRASRRPHRRPGTGRDRDRALRGEGLGDRGHPARRRRLQPSHGSLAAAPARRASARRWRRSTSGRTGHAGAFAGSPASRRSRAPIRTRRGSGGPTSACTRTSRSPSTRTRSPACTAGIRQFG